jgi:CDP-diacylglycerol--serine O-phosphatidyltransferase
LPKLQPRKNQLFNIGQAILIVITYICGFLFISEKVPFILEYLLVLCSTYLVVGFTIGLVQRKKIIENAEKNKIEERR